MSSESESEEFFDAEDDSPLKIRATSIDAPQETLCRQNSITSIDYEEEAKQLLERKRLVEERRRREEQEIEERLAEIQRRKEEEAERKRKIELERQKQEEDLRLEAEKKAKEREQRRNKLDLLRQSVADDSTPLKKLEGNTNIATDERTNQEDKQDGSHREHSQRPLEGASSDGANGIISDVKESEQKLSNFEEGSIRPCLTENIEIDTTSRATAESSMVVIPTSDCDSQNVNPMMKTDPSSPDINIDIPQTEKVNSKQIPTIEVTESQPRLDAQEPDIIKSTKNIRPLTLPPVAPPRRKKKTKSSQQEAPLSSSEPSLNLMTPTSTVESLTKDLEKSLGLPAGDAADLTRIPSMQFSLDINDVTCGDRLVKTEDVDCRAANVSQSELDKSLNDSVFDHSVNKAEGEDVSDSPSVPQALGLERPRSNSGRLLTDKEILEMVGLRNLDTGETIPLSKADLVFPAESNPLSIHIMKITKEFPREGDDRGVVSEDDTKSMVSTSSNPDDKSKKRLRLKKLFGRTVNKIKSVADEVLHADETSSDEEDLPEGQRLFRKVSRNHKGPYDFENLKQCQDLSGEHTGAVWIMKFSYCGRLLATGGQDNMLRVWVLKDSYTYFDEMRQKYSERKTGRSSPTPSQDSCISMDTVSMSDEACASEEEHLAPFISKSFCTYRGHTADVLDVSWSKNYFILTSSMDKTVRLWHISRRECLCCFQHIDFVTAIAFHPRDDRYFLSGSLDGKLRLWNIPDKKVALWNEISGPTKLITAASFCQNGKFAVVGTYDGRCIFYNTEQLKYYTVINVRSTRGKNAKGHKITGIESLPGEDKVLVTSNDSRIRLYDLRDLTLTCKYKGGSNSSSQIRGSFSCDGKYICCGSEDRLVYIWRTHHQFHKLSSARRDRNDYWVAFRVHEAVVTSAVFAPNPSLMFMSSDTMLKTTNKDNKESKNSQGQAFITADFNGSIKVFTSKFK